MELPDLNERTDFDANINRPSTSSPWGKDMKLSTLGTRRSNFKVTQNLDSLTDFCMPYIVLVKTYNNPFRRGISRTIRRILTKPGRHMQAIPIVTTTRIMKIKSQGYTWPKIDLVDASFSISLGRVAFLVYVVFRSNRVFRICLKWRISTWIK